MGNSESKSDTEEEQVQTVEFSEIEEKIATGDLAVLYRDNQKTPHFGVFIQHDPEDTDFPLMLVKGKTKPLAAEKFNPAAQRQAAPVTATSRIFYGDYNKVAIHRSVLSKPCSCKEALELADEIEKVAYEEEEIAAVKKEKSDENRSALLTTFMVALFYKKLGALSGKTSETMPTTLEKRLNLKKPTCYVKVPPIKPGPVINRDPPLLAQLVNGIDPPPNVTCVSYDSIVDSLDTGDVILFSGCTSSGAVIKFFDDSQFSHVGLIFKNAYTSHLFVWETTTNSVGIVDIDSGKATSGVQVIPLHYKVFSGWEDRVAIRRLTGIEPEKRESMQKDLLKLRKEVQGRPYEKSKVDLVLSSFDFKEDYLSFLRNDGEDLSSLFCSELVALAFQRIGLLGTDKPVSEYTPDDFTSKSGLTLNFGNLEEEVYIKMKFD